MHTRTQEQWPHKRLTQTCQWVSSSFRRRRGLTVACCRVRDTECSSPCMGPLEGGSHYFITSTIVWPQVKQQGGDTAGPINRKNELNINWAWPCPSEQDPKSIYPMRKFPWTSYPYSSEGRQTENPNPRKLTKLITWPTTLSNSIKLWAMQCRATQEGQVMMESSDKMWSTGEGKDKQLQYSCLRNPMISMKRQKDNTLKMNYPGL